MMLLKYMFLTSSDFRQGDWVDTGKYKGIYIATISSFESIIATYNDRKIKYVNVQTDDMERMERVMDGKLFDFAKKHILWRHREKKK